MEGVFAFLFGVAVGMAALPHVQRLAAQARRRLAELDRSKGPTPRS